MNRFLQRVLGYLILAGIFFSNGHAQTPDKELYDPVGLYLTWQHDPTTTMTIDWHTVPGNEDREPMFQYRKLGAEKWIEVDVQGYVHGWPFSDRMIRRIELGGLEPGTIYRFRFGDDSKEYGFETMPSDLSEPLRFAAGGDIFGLEGGFQKMNRVVMEYDPAFIVWGGDLAYANADPIRTERWHEFFDVIKETLIHENGQVVPIIVAIGNHELFSTQRLIWGRWPHKKHTREEAEAYVQRYNLWDGKPTWFFDLFAFPGKPSYNVLDFGDYMSLLVLDSNHYSPVVGAQTGWLEAVLEQRKEHSHIFPVYHIPAYPSAPIDAYEGTTNKQIRDNWVPLFEKYGVRVAFENHRHRYKRTHPLKNGKKAEDGIVYLGDGAWGVHNLRELTEENPWYIDKAASQNHAIIVTLKGEVQDFKVVNIEDQIIDSFTIKD